MPYVVADAPQDVQPEAAWCCREAAPTIFNIGEPGVGAFLSVAPDSGANAQSYSADYWPGTAASPEVAPIRSSRWISETSAHFDYLYLENTPAQRDLPLIKSVAESSLAYVTMRLGLQADERIQLYLVPQVFWQGGAAFGANTILLSYVDRNYPGIELMAYLRHEITHVVTNRWLTQGRGFSSILAEGLAVWTTGGHYRLNESIHLRARALVSGNYYIPLTILQRDFMSQQHEIAYMESASFVGYLLEKYGQEAFSKFYGAANQPGNAYPGKNWTSLEQDWRSWLLAGALSPQGENRAPEAKLSGEVRRWGLELRYYKLMRDYQTNLDPVARELPDSPEQWDDTQVAKYASSRKEPVQVAVESAMLSTLNAIRYGKPADADKLLKALVSCVANMGALWPAELLPYLEVAETVSYQERAIQVRNWQGLNQTLSPSSFNPAIGLVRRWQGMGTGQYHLEVVATHPVSDGVWVEVRDWPETGSNLNNQAGGSVANSGGGLLGTRQHWMWWFHRRGDGLYLADASRYQDYFDLLGA
ncbi:MAG: hypothetical protein HY326_09000 [Chloroflexi bacterium]|nr:hypothetical protein [Chloroflexota bacterium]